MHTSVYLILFFQRFITATGWFTFSDCVLLCLSLHYTRADPLIHAYVMTNDTFTVTRMHFMESSYAQANYAGSMWAKVEGRVRLLYDQLVREYLQQLGWVNITNADCVW